MPCGLSKEEILIKKKNLEPLLKKADLNFLMRRIEEVNSSFFYDFKVKQAREIIKSANQIFGREIAIAVSGGKDSLVCLHIALEVNPDILVLYNNTTVEFPETLGYMEKLKKEWNLHLQVTKGGSPYFQAVKEKGWATHENRWCCRPYKDEPAFVFLSQQGFKAEITGTTRTESIYRRSLSPVKMPKKEPYLIRVNPIYDWNEWEVWRYIRENNLPYNPLYDVGYRRIGCWCCPINGPTHYKRLKRTHPKLYEFLCKFIPCHPSISKLQVSSPNTQLKSERIAA
jgi:phosphoadenosine phosphosulfate reductase